VLLLLCQEEAAHAGGWTGQVVAHFKLTISDLALGSQGQLLALLAKQFTLGILALIGARHVAEHVAIFSLQGYLLELIAAILGGIISVAL